MLQYSTHSTLTLQLGHVGRRHSRGRRGPLAVPLEAHLLSPHSLTPSPYLYCRHIITVNYLLWCDMHTECINPESRAFVNQDANKTLSHVCLSVTTLGATYIARF
jgi:hypothetical protein